MPRKIKFMLADSFEVTGEWWLPENPQKKIHGILRYTHSNIELELSGSLDNLRGDNLLTGKSRFKTHSCIQGESNDGQKFTLLNTCPSSSGSTIKYTSAFIISNIHTPDVSMLKLTSLSFYCDHLDTFISYDPFTMEQDGEKEDFKSFTIKYSHPDKLIWRIDGISATLDFQMGVRCRTEGMNSELHAQSFITITPDTSQDLDWFMRQMWRFCYFLTLVTDEVVSPTGLNIDIEDEQSQGWLLYQTREGLPGDPKRVSPVFLFHFAHLRSDFESILNKFFSVDETMLDAIHLTMNASRNSEQTMHGHFLLLAHAVEVISRATTSSEYMSEDEYEKVIETLNAAIPNSVQSDHKMSLKNKIKYGNEYSFRKRIKTLLDSLSEDARKIVCNKPEEFAQGIVDTRNYYTHFTDELRPKALKGKDEFWAAKKLMFLVRILLLKDLGIDEAVIVDRLKCHPLLLQSIFYSKEHKECMTG